MKFEFPEINKVSFATENVALIPDDDVGIEGSGSGDLA